MGTEWVMALEQRAILEPPYVPGRPTVGGD